MYTHKNLTVMFTDICGFTRQTSTSSRNDMMARLEIHNALLTPVIRQWGGTIVKSIGDAFLLTFESPTDALHCAVCLQHTLQIYNRDAPEPTKIHIKISVNCGEVAVTDSDVFGDPVNVAAKIEKATPPDQIYFTEAVFLAMNQAEVPCEFVGTFAAKGDSAPETRLYRILIDDKTPRYQGILSAGADKHAAHLAASMPMSALYATFRRHWKLSVLVVVVLLALAGSLVLFGTSKGLQTNTDSAGPSATPSAAFDQTEQLDLETQPADSRKTGQAATLAWARAIVQDPVKLKDKSNAVIERLAADWGAQAATSKPALSLMQAALMNRIYWEARNASFDEAGELLSGYRDRFVWITDWNPMKREQYLGGFHNYASDQQLRRRWRNVWDARWNEHYLFLKSFAETDADFGLRLAVEFSEINRKNNAIAAPHEQELVHAALELKPGLLKTERQTLLTLAQWWLQFEQHDDSYARTLVREHFYKALRPWLVSNLEVKTRRQGPPEPDYPWRQNCLALLADRHDLDALGNPWAYIQDNGPVFMRASETVTWGDGTKRTQEFLTHQQIRHILQQPMNGKDQAALIGWIDQQLTDISEGKGPWAHNEDSRSTALAMKAALLSR